MHMQELIRSVLKFHPLIRSGYMHAIYYRVASKGLSLGSALGLPSLNFWYCTTFAVFWAFS
jgi:hypothetical protein